MCKGRDEKKNSDASYQDDTTDEDQSDKQIAWLREAAGINFQCLAVCEQEVWIHDQTQRRASDKEGSHESPDLRDP